MSDLEVVEAFGQAWALHDLDAAMQFLSDDCVFDSTGPAPDGSRHVGRDEVRLAWEPIFKDASSRFEAEETFSADNRVVQRWRYDWDGGHVRGVDLFKVRDGKITEKLSYVKG
ncbi:MAG: nuclear transport factor 2 family protein [Acidimicrobiales bacterium]|jgi:ketosteroid isomerase-like protein